MDHIYVNCPDEVKYTVNKPYCGGDHNCVGVVLRTRKFIPEGEDIISRCWGGVNWSWGKFLIKYSSILYKTFSYTNSNDILDCIEVELRTVMDTIAPEQLIRIRPGSQRWMTFEIRRMIKKRNSLKAAWHESGSRYDEFKFKEALTETRFGFQII